MSHAVTARACANIALVKYWGKRDAELNLPARGSLSLTLAELTTTATVEFAGELAADELTIDGQARTGADVERLGRWLDLVRARAGIDEWARITTASSFPTAAGLASSASAYAALALAATSAAGLDLDSAELSVLARRGSGSAARSIFPGFAELVPGDRDDGSDARARLVDDADGWPVRMIIAVVGDGQRKAISSRRAMTACADSSPLYPAWLDSVDGDLEAARAAISNRDLDALGRVAEASCTAMHGAILATRPSILYWEPATVACMRTTAELRNAGHCAYFTIDAGPHVKVLTTPDQSGAVAAALAGVDGVSRVVVSGPGPGAELVAP